MKRTIRLRVDLSPSAARKTDLDRFCREAVYAFDLGHPLHLALHPADYQTAPEPFKSRVGILTGAAA